MGIPLAGTCILLYEDSENAQQRFSNSLPDAARENLLFVNGIGMPTQEIEGVGKTWWSSGPL